MPASADIRQAAVKLLARREHSTWELSRKLEARGHSAEAVAPVLQALTEEGLLSDARYAEAYVSARAGRGAGPVRIRAELRERGVQDELIDRFLDGADPYWGEQAAAVRRKRFGAALPTDARERARQGRFLSYRGFAAEHIRAAMGPTE